MISSRAATLSTWGKALTKCLTFVIDRRKYLKGVLVGRDGGLDESFGDDKDSVFVSGEESVIILRSVNMGIWSVRICWQAMIMIMIISMII